MICALQKMSRAEDLWERLVRAVLRRERTGTDALGRPVGGIAGYVPSSLTNNRDIDEILRAADEIQDGNPAVSRICMYFIFFWLCHSYFACLHHLT
jgi:callose synthase